MKIFSWNVRGLNSTDRQRVVKDWVRSCRFSVGAFLETRVRHENAAAVFEAVAPGWRYETNFSSTEEVVFGWFGTQWFRWWFTVNRIRW